MAVRMLCQFQTLFQYWFVIYKTWLLPQSFLSGHSVAFHLVRVKGKINAMSCEALFNLPHHLRTPTLSLTTLPFADSTPTILNSWMLFNHKHSYLRAFALAIPSSRNVLHLHLYGLHSYSSEGFSDSMSKIAWYPPTLPTSLLGFISIHTTASHLPYPTFYWFVLVFRLYPHSHTRI